MNEKIISALSDIEKYFSDLESFGISSMSDLKGLEKYYASSMVLFSLVNRIIDLAQEIVISRKLGMPGSYREIFGILAERGIIDPKMFDLMKRYVALRNRLSHEYQRINGKELFNGIRDAGALRDVVSRLKKELG
jgi:uncharacterized protein YutE (UPF0331/DUF86 family)